MIETPNICKIALARKTTSKSPRMIPQLMILAFSLDEKRSIVSRILSETEFELLFLYLELCYF